MYIDTKFDIGHTVYSIIDQRLVYGIIEEVNVKNSIACLDITYKVKFNYEGGDIVNIVPEQFIFSTQEEVFEYLSSQLEEVMKLVKEKEDAKAKRLTKNEDDKWNGIKSWTS